MQRKVLRSIVRYSVSTATAAVIVAVYFRWLHVNETTVALTFLVGILSGRCELGAAALDLPVDPVCACL